MNRKKSTLLKVGVEELDTEADARSEKPVNLLREKTFNSELGLLLNKISNNERFTDSAQHENDDIIQDLSLKNAALHEIEKTIYELKHLKESGKYSGFNPFWLDINVYDEIDDLNDYIKAGLKQAGITRFMLMKFNLIDNAFRADLNFIDEKYTSDVFFGIRDKVIEQLKSEKSGIIITPVDIKNDSFLYKKFAGIFEYPEDITGYYIVRVRDICRESSINTFYEKKFASFYYLFSPILVVSLERDSVLDASDIFKLITRNASIPLTIYMMNHTINTEISGMNYRETLLMIDLFGRVFENSRRIFTMIILNDYSDKKNTFIYSFLLSKIRKRLQKNSLFIRINISQTVLVCSDTELNDIRIIIDDINRDSGIVTIESVNYSEYSRENHFTRLFL